VLAALLLMVTVIFDGTPVECAVDTGSAITVLAASRADRIPSKAVQPMTLSLQGVGGKTLSAPVYQLRTISTGDLHWQDPIIAVLPDETLGSTGCLLGMDLLGRQPVAFDWQARKVLPFKPSTSAPVPVALVTLAPAPDLAPEVTPLLATELASGEGSGA
jgi:hypothetical protein